MSLKKIALIALIVVMLVSSIIAFGCKPKAQDEVPVDSVTVEQPAPVDTVAVPAETPAPETK